MNQSSKRQRSLRNRRGGAAVEAALVLPMIVMFLFGVLEYGRYIMTLQVMTNAAREGARFALAHTQPVTVDGAVVDKALAGQALEGLDVQIYASDSLGNSIGSWNNAEAGDLVCVRVTGNYKSVITSLLQLSPTIPVSVQAAMRSESN
jgi:Flp pilus assembly protein TadG